MIIPHSPDGGNDKPVLPQHHLDLRASGLTDDTIAAAGLYSVEGGHAIREVLHHIDNKTASKMVSALAIPYFDAAGEPIHYVNGNGVSKPFIRLKPDKPRKIKDRTLKYESPAGAPSRLYIPPGCTRAAIADPTAKLIFTEGEKKALCADQHGLACVSVAGVWCFQIKRTETDARGRKTGPRELIPDIDGISWAGRTVVIAFDSDVMTKPNVQWACWHLAELLRDEGAKVLVTAIPSEADGAKNGLDDYIVRHGLDAMIKVLDAAVPPERPPVDDPRPKIIIGTDEYRVNVDAIVSLADDPALFQRAGSLVRVVRHDPHVSAVRRPPGSPMVQAVPASLLRERMTRFARWVTIRNKKEGPEEHPAHPPEWCVSAVHARATWPGIRHLEAVVNHPVMMADGSILARDGYDAHSGLIVSIPANLRLALTSDPSRKDVSIAVAAIEDAIADFPFESASHKAAWFAGLLTPLAWFGFHGPAPLLLIDGNTRGVGKGLLADVASIILTGRRFPVMSYTPDREELRKRITSIAMEGERMVLLDNLAGAVGNDVLDAALTSDRWKDRVLGVNKTYDGPLHVVWYATGNNVQLAADTSRRCLHCRMETAEERPELRTGLRYPDLRRHVREHRGELLSAAITILRGWHCAGRPRHNLPPWGSYEPWSDVIREAVVFAGLPDPGETREALQTTADRDAAAMSTLIDAMRLYAAERTTATVGVTAAEIIDAIRSHDRSQTEPVWYAPMRSAVEELCGHLDGRKLSYRFRHFARRNFGGSMIEQAGRGHGGIVRWSVRDLRHGGDGGNGGHVPVQVACAVEGEL